MALQRPAFATTTLTEGYDIGEVDDLVDRILEDLAGPTPTLTAGEVRDVRFTPVRLRKGYSMGEVDAWLDEVLVTVGEQPTPALPPVEQHPAAGPAPTAASQAAGDRVQAALIIAVALCAAVWIYVSRF